MKDKSLFAIGYLSYYLILPFIVPIVRVIRSLSLKQLDANDKIKDHPFIMTCIMFLAEIIAGCIDFFFHTKRSAKLIEKFNYRTSKLTPNQRTLKKRKITVKVLGIFFGLSLLDYTSTNGLSISTKAIGDYSLLRFQLKGVQIIFYAVLGYYILQYKIYRHHYLSIAFIFIGTILITCLSFDFQFWYVIPLILFFFGISGLQQTLQKWLMHYKYYRPFQILFYEGILGFAFSLLIIVMLSFIKCPDTWYCSGNYFEEPMIFFSKIDLKTGLYVFGINIMCLMGINGCNILVNSKFTPTHLVITDVFSSFLDWIVQLVTPEEKQKYDLSFFLPLLGYILFVLGGFIYNELIIFNFCSFGENTKKLIMKRGSIERKTVFKFKTKVELNTKAILLPASESDDVVNQ